MADPAAPLATHEGHETCAVCAHQGRTCPPDCRLAPHFPADKPKRFEYAYQIFGMRRILRALEADAAGLDAETRRREYGNIGMAGIVYTADARVEDPVLGAYGRIQKLRQELARLKAEHAARQQQQENKEEEESSSTDLAELPSGADPGDVAVDAAAEVTTAEEHEEEGHAAHADAAAAPSAKRRNQNELD